MKRGREMADGTVSLSSSSSALPSSSSSPCISMFPRMSVAEDTMDNIIELIALHQEQVQRERKQWDELFGRSGPIDDTPSSTFQSGAPKSRRKMSYLLSRPNHCSGLECYEKIYHRGLCRPCYERNRRLNYPLLSMKCKADPTCPRLVEFSGMCRHHNNLRTDKRKTKRETSVPKIPDGRLLVYVGRDDVEPPLEEHGVIIEPAVRFFDFTNFSIFIFPSADKALQGVSDERARKRQRLDVSEKRRLSSQAQSRKKQLDFLQLPLGMTGAARAVAEMQLDGLI